MSAIQKYDAIVVGAGATGAVFAYELTKAGMNVLCIEKGQFFQNHREEFVENELETFRLVWDYSGFQQLGLRSAAGRVAINSREYEGRSACLNCGYCRSGCLVDAKYQADEVLIKPALASGRLTLVTNSVVSRVETDSFGVLAKEVHYTHLSSGVETRAKGKFVILCNNPFEIPRLLLSSISRRHPQGIGNHFDQIGRNFFSHLTCVGLGLTDQDLRTFVGHSISNIMSLDTCINTERDDYVGGFSLFSLNGAGAGSLAAFPLHKLHGLDLKQRMANYNNSMVLIAFIEGMPVYDNRVSVNRNKTDALGMPLPQVHYQWHENDLRAFDHAQLKINQVLKASGSKEVFTSNIFESHPMGTMRMGGDPKSSATDRFGRVHGVPNLYVAGGCLFPTGSSISPTLTMHALALRSSRKIIHTWKLLQRNF